MRRSERLAVRIDHQDRVARRCLAAIQNIACENPGMAGGDTTGRFPADTHCVQVSSLPVGQASGLSTWQAGGLRYGERETDLTSPAVAPVRLKRHLP
jgi:hypothetical protein